MGETEAMDHQQRHTENSQDQNFFQIPDEDTQSLAKASAGSQESVVDLSDNSLEDAETQLQMQNFGNGDKKANRKIGAAGQGSTQRSLTDVWPGNKQVQARETITYSCPICEKELKGVSLLEFNSHLDQCLAEGAEIIDLDWSHVADLKN